MKNLALFNFSGKEIRVIVDETTNEPYWVAKDICEVLGYSDTQAMTRRLDDDEVSTYTDNLSGQVRYIKILNESGLYNAILGSKKPAAKRFKKWVTSEVLPTIRKTGAYALDRRTRYQIMAYKANLSKKDKKINSLEQKIKALETTQDSKGETLGNDASLHNNFLDFLYMGNAAVHQVGHLAQKHKELRSIHESLTTFMHFIMLRHSNIKGVNKRLTELLNPNLFEHGSNTSELFLPN